MIGAVLLSCAIWPLCFCNAGDLLVGSGLPTEEGDGEIREGRG
jgi:hypothetical protein